MRPTSTRRGIKGLFPLVRALVPASISAPFPASSLRGLRLAIDATLLIQKLHFADDPHPSRHLIGFYRLVNTLREHGVTPIMIFDHPSKRLAAKNREQGKRKKKRELDRMRSRMEGERKLRLRELEGAIDTLRTITPQERAQVGALLESWQKEKSQAAATVADGAVAPDPDAELADRFAAEFLASRDVADWDARRPELWQQARKAVLDPLAGSSSAIDMRDGEGKAARSPDALQADNLDLLQQLGQRARDDPALSDAAVVTEAGASSPDDLYDLAGDENLVSLERHPISAFDTPTPKSAEGEWQQVLEDLTSKSFALALRVDRSQRQFESTLTEMGEFQSKSQKELTEFELKLYDQIIASLKPPSPAPSLQATSAPTSTATSTRAQAESASSTSPTPDLRGASGSDADEALTQAIGQVAAAAAAEQLASDSEAADEKAQATLPPSVSPLKTLNRGLSKTYARSTMPLPSSIYGDCAHLCSLMAVPVFWTGDGTRSGGGRIHEAEAYASSLVKAGYADIVASEDSDVLLYDTPLLRGLIGGVRLSHPPPAGVGGMAAGKRLMEVVDGRLVRKGLFDYGSLRSLYQRRQQEAIEQSSAKAAETARRKGGRTSWTKAKTLLLAPTATRSLSESKSTSEDPSASETTAASQPASGPPTSTAAATAPSTLDADEYEKMTQSMMLDFALLCGTDFNRTVPGVGPKTALKLILQHGSITKVLENESKKFRPPDGLSIKEYEAELRDARTVFTNPPKVRATARSVFTALSSASKAQSRGRSGATRVQEAEATSEEENEVNVPWTRRFFDADSARQDDSSVTNPEGGDISELNVTADTITAASASTTDFAAADTDAGPAAPAPDAVTSDGSSALDLSGSSVSAMSTMPSSATAATYDRQAVLDYLRLKGVFGAGQSSSKTSLWHSREDDTWRDIMDLELGITVRSGNAQSDDKAEGSKDEEDMAAIEAQWQTLGGGMVTGTEKKLMGVDFFGERESGTACWSPEMEMSVRRSTTIAAVE